MALEGGEGGTVITGVVLAYLRRGRGRCGRGKKWGPKEMKLIHFRSLPLHGSIFRGKRWHNRDVQPKMIITKSMCVCVQGGKRMVQS